MIVNAMAKAVSGRCTGVGAASGVGDAGRPAQDMKEGALLRHLSSIVQMLPMHQFAPQSVSTIANAYAKLGHRDAALFAYLEETTMLLPASSFSSQVRGCSTGSETAERKLTTAMASRLFQPLSMPSSRQT